MSTLVEAYLLIDQPRQRLGHWSEALAAIDSHQAPPLAAVVAFYDPVTDQALLKLRYDVLALGPQKLDMIVEIAVLAEVGMIQPAVLSDGERKRFVSERLARCTLQVTTQRTALHALAELVRQLREQRNSPKLPPLPLPLPEPPTVSSALRGALHRGDTSDPEPLVTAKGTRDDIPRRAASPDAARIALSTKGTRDGVAIARVMTPNRNVNVVTRVMRAPTAVAPDDYDADAAREFEDRTAPQQYVPLARSESPKETMPDPSPMEIEPSTIYARYLRSGKWVPIRIGALSLKGAALMTGALPRLHDHVDVALSFSGHRALVRGEVGKISSMSEAVATGASTFSVAFELDNAARRQLTALLTAAREAKIMIKPPPPRSTRRFVVDWPMCLGTMRGAIKAEALDISTTGMFVRPTVSLTLESVLNFSAVLDDGAGPVAGRARAVRQLTEYAAASCGLAPGFGLQIVDMSATDQDRWNAFIARIERRSAKRVMIGASPQRLGELQAALAAAGYAVLGGTDPGALVQLANSDSRPVDAALIDASWLDTGTSASWVESLFSARDVPCITVRGDIRRARAQVDRLLRVDGSPETARS